MGVPEKLLDYIIQHTDRRFDEMHERLEKIDSKVEVLLQFKWQILGGAAVVAAIVGIAVQLVSALLSRA